MTRENAIAELEQAQVFRFCISISKNIMLQELAAMLHSARFFCLDIPAEEC
jgi:hypothetical protein